MYILLSGTGDTAVALIKEEADFTLKNNDGELAIDLAPDQEVSEAFPHTRITARHGTLTYSSRNKVRHFIIQGAEREGISLVD